MTVVANGKGAKGTMKRCAMKAKGQQREVKSIILVKSRDVQEHTLQKKNI